MTAAAGLMHFNLLNMSSSTLLLAPARPAHIHKLRLMSDHTNNSKLLRRGTGGWHCDSIAANLTFLTVCQFDKHPHCRGKYLLPDSLSSTLRDAFSHR